jgi:hypothetical protein
VLHALSKRCSPETVAAVLSLRDGLLARGARVTWGHGASPSMSFWIPFGGKEQPLFTVFAYTDNNTPAMEVAFAYLRDRGATPAPLEQIAKAVRGLPHAAARLNKLESADYRRRPGLGLDETVAAPGAVNALLHLVDDLQASK